MKLKTFKKLTSVLLAVMLVVSMCVIGISSVSAAAVSDGTTVVYLKPNSNWASQNARFAVYLFKGATNVWTDMSDEDEDGYYSATLPEGDWEKVIFCRMNPNKKENSWDTKWNQTSNLDIPEGMNCYTVKASTWDKGGGTWSLFDPEQVPSEDPTEGTTREVIQGDPDSYYLFGSIDGSNYGCEEDSENAGIYKFVDGKLTATFESDSYVAVKTGDNAKWYMTKGWLGTNVKKAVLYNTSTLGTTANKLFVPGGKTVTFTLADNGDETFTLSYSTGEDPTDVTDPTDATDPTEPVPTEPVPTEPTEPPTNPVDADYYLFGSINGKDYGCEADYENMGDYKFVDGKVTASFTETSYVGVKATDNVAWYMTDGWLGEVTSATLYNTSVLGVTANKLMVPAGVIEFTLVVNDNGTVTLSYEVVGEPPVTDPTDPTEPQPTDPTDPQPTEPTEPPTHPVGADFYLFGSINGEDYGCGADYANMGDYKFVDGKLTATFEEASYVGVKATDNAAWYMTDGWLGEVTTATLYSTAVLGETANKLMVPAGKINFTLVVNDDGTLTLSYTVEEVPTEPTTPTEPPITDTTLKFIVPKTKSSPKCWDNGVYLAYSNNYALNGFTKIPLVKTTDYLTPELKTDRLVSDTYAMYKVDLTEEQAKAINEATYVILVNSSNTYRTYVSGKYNILRAPVGVDADEYNTAKTSIANLNGYTFIMNGEVETGTSIQGYGTYTGYWTKCTNLQVVVPSASIWNNCWNQGVYIGYSDSYILNTFTKIKMTRTSTFVDVTTNTTQLLSGSYPVYTVSLTEEQVAAIDAATYVIFENASGTYRTYINGKYNVLRAAVDEYSDTYGAKSSVADRANNTFILCGGVKTGTSIEGYGTFTGYWSTKELEIVESTATLYCVFPAPAKNGKAMDDGVYMAYGNSNASGDLTYLEMEKTSDLYTPSLKTNQLKAGEYSVYKITLSGSELEAVDNAKNVIFSNKTGIYRTLLSPTYNVFNAKSGSYSAVYNTAKFVAEDHNGETFVVCDSKVTGTSTDGYGTFLGYWDLGE